MINLDDNIVDRIVVDLNYGKGMKEVVPDTCEVFTAMHKGKIWLILINCFFKKKYILLLLVRIIF